MSEETRKEEVYALYALSLTEENMKAAAEVRFQRVTADYILLYTKTPPPKGAVEVKGKDVYRLTKQEQKWVFDCVALVMRQAITEQEAQSVKRAAEFLEQLEAELKREAVKPRKGGEGP